MKNDKVVFISGGTGSVGSELVVGFRREGYEVIFQFFRATEVAKRLARETGAVSVQCDLANPAAIEMLRMEEVDILINNAAINESRAASGDVTLDVWSSTLAINLTAPFLLCRSALPGMLTRGWGRILNISSIYGLRGCDGNLPYVVSKHGLSGLTKTIARDYAARGVRCNEICPGPIESELLTRIAEYYSADRNSTDEYKSSLAAEIPTQRLAHPSDVLSAALFLASEQADYVNGVSLVMDGGLIS